jgi:hypothetical protein
MKGRFPDIRDFSRHIDWSHIVRMFAYGHCSWLITPASSATEAQQQRPDSRPWLARHRYEKGQSGNPGGWRKGAEPPIRARVASLRRALYRVYLENEEEVAEVFRQRLLNPRYQHEALEMLGRLTRELVPSADATDGRVSVIVLGSEKALGLVPGMFRQAVEGQPKGATSGGGECSVS